MKIGLVSPYDYCHPGGVSLHVNCLAHQFLENGHSVRIIAPCSSPPIGELRHFVIPQGRPISVPSGGSIARVTFSLRLTGPIRSLLEKENFDVVHIHEPLISTLPLTVLRLSESLNVGTFHAFHSKPRGYGLAKPILGYWIKRLHGRIAVSEPARNFVSRHFPGEYRVIPNGIDIQKFSPGEPSPSLDYLNDGRLNLLFVGRLEKRKGLDCLLKSYQNLKKDYPEARLVVVGPGKRLLKKYKSIVQEKEIKDVVFAGYVPSSELPNYYRSAHVFCAPAIGDESFGIVLLEAMACGKPVVASNIQGYAGVISQGEDGFLVPPKDEKAFSNALGSLLSNRALREEMGNRGRLKAQKYCWENIAGMVLDYFGELMKGRIRLRSNEQALTADLTAFQTERV